MRVRNSHKFEPYSYSQGSSVKAAVIYDITNRPRHSAQWPLCTYGLIGNSSLLTFLCRWKAHYGWVAWCSYGILTVRALILLSACGTFFLLFVCLFQTWLWWYVTDLIVDWYAVFGWCTWEVCSFLRGDGVVVDLGEKGDRCKRLEEGDRGKTAVRMKYIYIIFHSF